MLTRTLRFCFTHGHKHLNHSEINLKMNDLRNHIKKASQELDSLKLQVKQKEAESAQRNKVIHEKRVRLTDDVKKGEKVWEDAKKQSEAHKSAAIQNFASSLVSLGNHFDEIKLHQNEKHSVDLRQGFANTARLFFNTLEKFKINQVNISVGAKVSRDQIEIVGEEKSSESNPKDSVARVVEAGWEVDGKVIRKPKIVLFV